MTTTTKEHTMSIEHDTWIWDCGSQTVSYAGDTWDPQTRDWAEHAAAIEQAIEAGAARVVTCVRTVTVPDDHDGWELGDIADEIADHGQVVTNEEGFGLGGSTVAAGDRLDVWATTR